MRPTDVDGSQPAGTRARSEIECEQMAVGSAAAFVSESCTARGSAQAKVETFMNGMRCAHATRKRYGDECGNW